MLDRWNGIPMGVDFFTRQELDGDLESGGNTEIFEIDLEYGAIEENGRPEYLIRAGRSCSLLQINLSMGTNRILMFWMKISLFSLTTRMKSQGF